MTTFKILEKFSDILNNDGTGRDYKYSVESWKVLVQTFTPLSLLHEVDLSTAVLTIESKLYQDADDAPFTIWAFWDEDDHIRAIALSSDGQLDWIFNDTKNDPRAYAHKDVEITIKFKDGHIIGYGDQDFTYGKDEDPNDPDIEELTRHSIINTVGVIYDQLAISDDAVELTIKLKESK